MKIHFYGIVWNEAAMLPYFFRHYDALIERYVFFDDGSDDGTRQILTRHPRVDLRSFAATNDSVIESAQVVKSQAWKESRGAADFVLVCDVDELLYFPGIEQFLSRSQRNGGTIFRPAGWQMVHESFPDTDGQIYEQVRHGFRATHYDKPCLFDPNQIDDIGYLPGCHTAKPTGKVVWNEDEQLRLLHFKYLGAPYVTARYMALNERLGRRDREHGWGAQYRQSELEVRDMFSKFDLHEMPSQDIG